MLAYTVLAAIIFTFLSNSSNTKTEYNTGFVETDERGIAGYEYLTDGYIVAYLNNNGVYSFSAVSDTSNTEIVIVYIDGRDVKVLFNINYAFFADVDSLSIDRIEPIPRYSNQ